MSSLEFYFQDCGSFFCCSMKINGGFGHKKWKTQEFTPRFACFVLQNGSAQSLTVKCLWSYVSDKGKILPSYHLHLQTMFAPCLKQLGVEGRTESLAGCKHRAATCQLSGSEFPHHLLWKCHGMHCQIDVLFIFRLD